MPEAAEPKQTTKFQPGQSGNPAGRPLGSRNKLGDAFLKDLEADWSVNGANAIRACREEDAATYCKIVASLLPKEHIHKAHDPLDDLSDDDVAIGLAAIRAAREAGPAISAAKSKAGSAKASNPVH